MPQEQTAGPVASESAQAGGPASEPTTQATAPDSTAGQPDAPTGQSTTDPENSFFDPRELDGKPELQAAYKGMQKAFTKRMQELSQHRQKIQAYDDFSRDPVGMLQRLAQQHGYHLTPAQAQAAINQQQQAAEQWEPKTWDEVIDRAEKRAEERLMQRMQPIMRELQTQKKSSIERELSEIDPAWQQYEDSMRDNLSRHPSLATDPAMLYRMSVPPEVIESRAVSKALKKMEAKGKSAQVQGNSQTPKQSSGMEPDGPIPFAKAVELAKARLAEQGIHPGK